MKKRKKIKKLIWEAKKPSFFALPAKTRRWIFGVVIFIVALLIILSFFDLAGTAGKAFIKVSLSLIGKAVFALPLILILGGLALLSSPGLFKKGARPLILAIFILILGLSGIFASLNTDKLQGGWFGFYLSFYFLKFFGFWATQIIFFGLITIGALIIVFQALTPPTTFLEEEKKFKVELKEKKRPLIIRMFKKVVGGPKFKIKKVPSLEFPFPAEPKKEPLEFKTKPLFKEAKISAYLPPPLDLLEADRGEPSFGDIRINSAIIKRTLQNFDIPVEMSEVNIGPTVTQYTLKPAEGVKLAKITALSNDLALALSSHPIRIEAPIPGRPLVGIEVPNSKRALVRLRNLISLPNFQNSISNLTFILGRDVAGNPVFADLDRIPHLLVAGSTGTGKTICLNSIILSLLYRNGPEILKFILIDPKRVEFPIYNELPHLLCPVIFDAQKTVNVLKWLIEEMERRFDILSESKSRDISAFNEIAFNPPPNFGGPIPYIILIIDELADLMASRGREIEAGIVRLAQMARAVGIHLIVATQRPSVEVITGLIKANITSRITFQVASQVDSRTVFDMAGAEKLLGLGDLLFVSAEITKPRRIQGAYVSEKEIKRVVNYIKTQNSKLRVSEGRQKIGEGILETGLAEDLEKKLAAAETEFLGIYGKDPLYEEAKRVVIEAKKASASLLQRRLRIGYARAARLIDMLEEKGVVGPGEGAKPREVYLEMENEKDV